MRRVGVFVDETAAAGLADAAAAQIVALRLRLVLRHKRIVDQRIDARAQWRDCAAIDEAGFVIEIDHHRGPQYGISPAFDWRSIESWKPSTQASMMRSISSVRAVEERIHQVHLVEHLREEVARIRDGALFHVGLVDHAVVLHCERGAEVQAAQRAEAVKGIEVVTKRQAEAEAAGLPAAEGAWDYPAKSSWSGRRSFPASP